MIGRFKMSTLFTATLVIALAASRGALAETTADRWQTYNNGYDGDRFSAAAEIRARYSSVSTRGRMMDLKAW